MFEAHNIRVFRRLVWNREKHEYKTNAKIKGVPYVANRIPLICENCFRETLQICAPRKFGAIRYLVLGICCLSLCISTGSGMAELHLRGEHLGTCSDAPCHNWFEQPTRLESFTYLILLHTSNLHITLMIMCTYTCTRTCVFMLTLYMQVHVHV